MNSLTCDKRMAKETPVMQQWREAKERHPDCIMLFQIGDFMETFMEDAETCARVLGITLTSRNNGAAAQIPLAGFPIKARDEYVERLVKAGYRVALCEQVQDPSEAKGIVRREVVETVTPGVILADTLLNDRRNNFIVSLVEGDNGTFGVAAADISTGELFAVPCSGETLSSDVARLEPAELLLPRSWESRSLEWLEGSVVTYRADWLFDADLAEKELCKRFRVRYLDGLGFGKDDQSLISALGGLLSYLKEVQPTGVEHLRAPRIDRSGDAMALDEMTRRNLELVEPLRPDLAGRGTPLAGTLLGILDETQTPMGARLLRRWILRPLVDVERIVARQEAVAEFAERLDLRQDLRAALKPVRDLERLAAKLGTGRITPRELRVLADSLGLLPQVKEVLESTQSPSLQKIARNLDVLEDVVGVIRRAISENPPVALAEGGVIRLGYDAELDELRSLRDGARDFIGSIQTRERERTGISSLKVGFNQVFGYYIEVTRANLDKVPEDYERKQTLANGERYITPELKEYESKVLGAEERIGEMEARLFHEVRRQVASEVERVQSVSSRISVVDVLSTLAEVAVSSGYVRPTMHTGRDLKIEGGRHPVVETMMHREDFIPNDVFLSEEERVMILTGPNMGGKSTLLRMVGLIQLMGQIGSFVPATAASLPVCDRIFTRVGASDNLVRGQSTFLVETSETAAILNSATARSLVLIDELGRGTATYDGVSLAWAVTEHLHDVIGCWTIFATHYHELTQLADMLPALVNFNVAVRESGDDIVFLHRLERGGADRSYGIEVGRIAGLPSGVVGRAREILRRLEGARTVESSLIEQGHVGAQVEMVLAPPDPTSSSISSKEREVLERIRALDPYRTNPLEALNLLAEVRSLLDS